MVHAPVRNTPSSPGRNMPPVRLNLYSDTQTKPSAAMKDAMMRAEVGDEQHGDDPTVDELCDRAAALLGKEAAVFLPTGTMCNQIAILTHCRPGDEILAHRTAHILTSEGGAFAALSGAFVTALDGDRGRFDVATLHAAFRQKSRYAPPQALVSVEQTANLAGGAVWPVAALDAVAGAAHEAGLATHMDGARLMNAAVASGAPAHAHAAGYDTVWLDFTKGLGAPLGAVLAGSAETIGRAWLWKQRLGGAMRQAGICAAACIYSLDHNVDRLADDHARARALAEGLAAIPGFVVTPPETNLVFVDTSGTGLEAEEIERRVRMDGLMISSMGRHVTRACTHLDVNDADVEEAVAIIRRAVTRG